MSASAWSLGTVRDFSGTGEKFEYPVEDTYTFEFVEKGPDEPVAEKYNPNGNKFKARFTFRIVGDEDYEGTDIYQWYTLSLNEKSNLRPVVEALLGGPLTAGQEITSEALIGKRMKAMLKHRKTEEGKVYVRLEGAIPVRDKKKTGGDEPPF